MFIRQANQGDVELVLEILNSELAAADPAHGLFGPDIAKQMIDPPGDRSPTWLFSENDTSVPFGVGNLNPDLAANKLQAEISVRAGNPRFPDLLDWFIELAQRDFPTLKFQMEVNLGGEEKLQHLAARDFKIIRYYNTLSAPVLSGLADPVLPEDVYVKTVDLANMEDVRTWHRVYQSSFAENFGFTPKDFDTWYLRIKDDEFVPADGIFLIHLKDEPVGFIWTDDMDGFDLRGFVVGVGVLKEHQGKGLGQLLLATAKAHFSRRGYNFAELGVDTQNASNALRVYEKMGFIKKSTWVDHERQVS